MPPEELTTHAIIMSVVIDVYKFGQEIFTIDIFGKYLYKYQKTIPVKAFLQHGQKHLQPVQIKLFLDENLDSQMMNSFLYLECFVRLFCPAGLEQCL